MKYELETVLNRGAAGRLYIVVAAILVVVIVVTMTIGESDD